MDWALTRLVATSVQFRSTSELQRSDYYQTEQ